MNENGRLYLCVCVGVCGGGEGGEETGQLTVKGCYGRYLYAKYD